MFVLVWEVEASFELGSHFLFINIESTSIPSKALCQLHNCTMQNFIDKSNIYVRKLFVHSFKLSSSNEQYLFASVIYKEFLGIPWIYRFN